MNKSDVEKILVDYLTKIYQSGKRETSGLVIELKEDMARLSHSLENHTYEHKMTNDHLRKIDEHLANLNSKVKTNADNITDLQKRNIINEPKLKLLVQDLELREDELKQNNRKWRERVFWVVIVLLVLVLVRLGIIAPELADKFI